MANIRDLCQGEVKMQEVPAVCIVQLKYGEEGGSSDNLSNELFLFAFAHGFLLFHGFFQPLSKL